LERDVLRIGDRPAVELEHAPFLRPHQRQLSRGPGDDPSEPEVPPPYHRRLHREPPGEAELDDAQEVAIEEAVDGRVDERPGPGEHRPAGHFLRPGGPGEEQERHGQPAPVEEDPPEEPHSGTAKRMRNSGRRRARPSRRQAASMRVLPSAKEKLAPAEVLGSSQTPAWRTDPTSKKTPKWLPSYCRVPRSEASPRNSLKS